MLRRGCEPEQRQEGRRRCRCRVSEGKQRERGQEQLLATDISSRPDQQRHTEGVDGSEHGYRLARGGW